MKIWIPPKQTFSYKTRKYLEEYGKRSTIHGIYYLTEQRSRIEKFFWITILSLSLSLCIFMILQIWKKFEENPIIVTFAPKESQLYETPFPAVTICPEEKCVTSKFNFEEVYKKILKHQELSNQENRTFYYLGLLCENPEEHFLTVWKDNFLEDDFFDVIDKVRPRFTIDECSFLGSNFTCEDYFLQLLTDQGICYSFNTLNRKELFRENVFRFPVSESSVVDFKLKNYDPEIGYSKNFGSEVYPLRATMAGADNALKFYLEYNTSDTDYECNTFSQGFRVAIHNPINIPRLSKFYYKLPHDKDVMILVQPNLVSTTDEVKRYDARERGCYLKNERPLKYFKMYTQANCLLECSTNFTLKMCGCVQFFMPREHHVKMCGPSKITCLKKAERYMKNSFYHHDNLQNQTFCDCQPSCNILSYDIETSGGDFYWQGYINGKSTAEKDENDSIRYSQLTVYFKSDNFMKLERKEMYGIIHFISNFGGLLSLFTGFSIISLFEVVYFLTLRICCNRRLYKNWAGSMT